jgi:hypothetical protein
MPIALSRAPIVVGIRQTSRAISTGVDSSAPAKSPNGRSVTHTSRKISVSAASSTVSATSLGVFWRRAPSTIAIMRSRKPWPRSIVMRTTMRSLSTRVPPLTAQRSPPLSRITGADSPVIADSSTLAMPWMTSPSAGMVSPLSQTTRSPLRRSVAGTRSSPPSSRIRRANVSDRCRRSASA